MKSSNGTHNRKKNLIYYSLVILLVSVTTGFSQQDISESIDIHENEKTNYIDGITSDNPGLKASCIYFAGRYRLAEAGDLLVDELKKSEEEDLTLLIAWSIYRIGNERGLEELKRTAANHTSRRLKRFCFHMKDQENSDVALANTDQS